MDFRDDYSSAVLPKLLEGNVLPDFTILDNDQTFDKMMNDFVNIDFICKRDVFYLSENQTIQIINFYTNILQKIEWIILLLN